MLFTNKASAAVIRLRRQETKSEGGGRGLQGPPASTSDSFYFWLKLVHLSERKNSETLTPCLVQDVCFSPESLNNLEQFNKPHMNLDKKPFCDVHTRRVPVSRFKCPDNVPDRRSFVSTFAANPLNLSQKSNIYLFFYLYLYHLVHQPKQKTLFVGPWFLFVPAHRLCLVNFYFSPNFISDIRVHVPTFTLRLL